MVHGVSVVGTFTYGVEAGDMAAVLGASKSVDGSNGIGGGVDGRGRQTERREWRRGHLWWQRIWMRGKQRNYDQRLCSHELKTSFADKTWWL